MQETQEFERIIKQIENTHRRIIPNLVATVAVNFSKERFKAQNWVDSNTKPWRRRKTQTWRGKTPRNNGRAVLVDTGRLRRSIRKIKVDSESVIIGTDVEYARAHNEGFNGTITQTVKSHSRNKYGKAKQGTGVFSVKSRKERTRTVKTVEKTSIVRTHTRTIKQRIPQRQFIGESQVMNWQIERAVTAAYIKALK